MDPLNPYPIGVSLTKSIHRTKSEYHMINDESERGTVDKTFSEDIIQPYQCQQCSLVFKNYIGLGMHISKKHGSGWREYVEKLVLSSNASSDKKQRRKGQSLVFIFHEYINLEQQYVSQLSRIFFFFYQNQLKTHKLVHSDERNCVCDICGLKLKSDNRVRAHKTRRGRPR